MPNDTVVFIPRYQQIIAAEGSAALRAAVVAEARTWLLPVTKFAHQQRRKGVGVDCIGVPVEVGRVFDFPCCEGVPHAYTRQPDGRELLRELHERMDPVFYRNKQAGDVIVCAASGKEPSHLVMVTQVEPLMILHASLIVGRVIEHGADASVTVRFRQTFRYRGIDG